MTKKAMFVGGSVLALIVGGAILYATVKDNDDAKRFLIEKMYTGYKSQAFPDIKETSPKEARELAKADKAILVDAREPKEQAVSMIPGAITKQEFEGRRAEFRNKIIIPYCTIGARSGDYAKELAEAGFDARNLKGSILSWSHEGYLFESKDGPTKKAHVYGKPWDLLAEGYEAVY